MRKKFSMEIAVGVFVLAALACIGYMTVQLGQMRLTGEGYYSIKARFSRVTGLTEGNEVRISGVPVGRVSDITLETERFAAIVTLKLENDITLSDDSIAAIKTSGLIGDKYVSISPGGSGFELQPGDMIIDTQPPLDIQELIGKYVFGDVGQQQ
jgi:phospholipid/cholesterol/gamma-HCH transport system substrate-binding protein